MNHFIVHMRFVAPCAEHRYLGMSLSFEGSAELPPEWDERIMKVHAVVEGNYHHLKLAQQMKILQTVLRRDVITLRTADMASHPDASGADQATDTRGRQIPTGTVVIEHRKMMDFLYEWNEDSKARR